jgi:hypothetical protein
MNKNFTTCIRWEDITSGKQAEIEQEFLSRKMGDIDEIDFSGPVGDGVLTRIQIESI